MNHMKDVAHLLGLELEEEFRFKTSLIGLSTYRFRFTENYLQYYYQEANCWSYASFETICGLLSGKYEVVKLPILDDIEKKYLKGVIRPFRDDVESICKCETRSDKKEWIGIRFKSTLCEMYFPEYPAGTMYRGMALNRKYSIEELGL